MASKPYPSGMSKILTGEIHLVTDNIYVQAIDSADYSYNAAHDFLDDIAAGCRVGTGVIIAGRSVGVSGGSAVFYGTNTTIPLVSGDTFEALLIYKWTGAESTSPLIALIDGISVTPTGQNVLISWDPAGIFSVGTA